MENSPYLKYTNRLSDVISAIQVMSIYKFYKLDFKKWSFRICGNEKNDEHWKQIFIQHPEFFRLDSNEQKASLVWRRSKAKTFHVDLEKSLKFEEVQRLNENEKNRVSRMPLKDSEIQTLISTAINLHNRALEHQKDKRWWVIPIITALAGLVGVCLGAIINKYF